MSGEFWGAVLSMEKKIEIPLRDDLKLGFYLKKKISSGYSDKIPLGFGYN